MQEKYVSSEKKSVIKIYVYIMDVLLKSFLANAHELQVMPLSYF